MPVNFNYFLCSCKTILSKIHVCKKNVLAKKLIYLKNYLKKILKKLFLICCVLLPLIVLQACLRHPDSSSSRENRDTVFCQMRRAMDLIHYVVKDGVMDGGGGGLDSGGEEWDAGKTVLSAIRHFESTGECEILSYEQ